MLLQTKAAITRYCEYQERCHSEVRNKLYELGCTTSEVEDGIAGLIEIDLLNEERFARSYARGKFRMKQWGREKIKQQLKLKKISDFCIKKGLSEIDAEEYDRILHKLMEKKLNELKSERSELVLKLKIYRYIVQKGYERDIVIDLLNTMIKEKKKY